MLSTKIPPPIVMLCFALGIVTSKNIFPEIKYDYLLYMGVAFELFGLVILMMSIIAFRKNKTTISPFRPYKASSLVVDGVFAISRNPMYLAMASILFGLSLQFNVLGGLLFFVCFISYINVWQIKPEEKALLSIFAAEYITYKNTVRRWI
ncbi:MAG: hypothetical protein CMM25_02240 [Rhodospirillaceae bacterium]|nr:hypothetical protein [Rhodospirillaceae bacterium]